MLGPIPAARARKRAETLYDRHATLTKSAALLSSRETEGKINADRSDTIGTRNTTVTKRRRLLLDKSSLFYSFYYSKKLVFYSGLNYLKYKYF